MRPWYPLAVVLLSCKGQDVEPTCGVDAQGMPALEACNGIDDDCDGQIDESPADGLSLYVDGDGDGDGYGAGEVVIACAAASGFAAADGDCDDGDDDFYPGAAEDACVDDEDLNCDGVVGPADADDDGYDACVDCDDAASDVHPDGVEVPFDDLDNDCNATTLDGDGDADGFVAPADCDDARADVYPGAAEADCADPVDYNCDGNTGYADADGDEYAACEECDDAHAEANPSLAEVPYDGLNNDCDPSTLDDDLDEDGAIAAVDCDDSDPTAYPDAVEVPFDGVNNDCDLSTGDEDGDQDGFDAASDCDDDDAAVNPDALEDPYDGVDNDCDPETRDDDLDGDGYWLANDCNDANNVIHPGGTEVCGGADEDCDGTVDEADVYGDAVACAADSCKDIRDTRVGALSGRYWIDPSGAGAYEVACDMASAGGGWTLVVRAKESEIDAGDPPDFDYNESVWTGAGYGTASGTTHIGKAWSDTPAFTELRWTEGAQAWQESYTTTADLKDVTKSSGTLKINLLESSSYGPYGGRLYRNLASAQCNTANGSTGWGVGLGAVRSCEHTYGTLYYEFSSYGFGFTEVALWIR